MSVTVAVETDESHPKTPEQSGLAITHPLYCAYADGEIFLRTPDRAEAEKAVACILRTPGRYADLRVQEDRRHVGRHTSERAAR